MNRFLRYSSLALITATSLPLLALEAIDDSELGKYTGQAFITVDADSYSDPTYGDFEFTKVNIGADVETLLNIDELRLGEFERTFGDGSGVASAGAVFDEDGMAIGPETAIDENGNVFVPVLPADIIIKNFGLGRVDDYDKDNPVIVPFEIKDPFIELAYKVDPNNPDVREVAGLRIGFGRARGDLSGDLISLTGNLQGEIRGPASVAREAACEGETPSASWFQCVELSIAGETEIYADVTLLDVVTGEGQIDGARYIKRASWIGVPEGTNFDSDDGGIGDLIPALTESEDCRVIGVIACYPTQNYQSVYVGDPDAGSFEEGASSGAFISIQSQTVPWKDESGLFEAGLSESDRIYTDRGAYLNVAKYADANGVAKYPLYLDLYTALAGAPRIATCIGRLKGC